jgi:hypothetical protein
MAGHWIREAWREAPPRLMAASQELVGAVEGELRSRWGRRLAARWATRSLIFATGLCAVGGLLLAWHPQALAPLFGRPDPGALVLLPGDSASSGATVQRNVVAAGARLLSPEASPLRLGSADGTALTLDPGASLTVIEAGATKRFALLRGAVSVHVKKLAPGERFIVDTADTEIEVHGTTFRVALSTVPSPCGDSSPTRVAVSEGVVTVNRSGREEYLRPGDEWPPGCAPAVMNPDRAEPRHRSHQTIASKPVHSPESAAIDESTLQPERHPAPAASTSLEAQNDLFSAAVRARRAGQVALASRLFDRFVLTYPDSSLVESALVQQMRLLVRTDSAAAVAVANRYLARFPDGFARTEARALTAAQAPR